MKSGRKPVVYVVVATLFIFSSASVNALEVYKWVNSDGVTHYAEASPESDIASLEILDITTSDLPPPAAVNYQSALEVAGNIEASRLERERTRREKQKLLLEQRQLKLSQQAAQRRAYANDADANGYYLPYNTHRYRHPRTPHSPGHTPEPTPLPHGNNTARTFIR